MAATRSRTPRSAGYARRSTVRNGCLEKVKRSAAGPPPTPSQMNRLPQQRTPQHLPLPNSGHKSGHGSRPSRLRPLRHKNHPNIRSPSLPSRRRGPISSGNPSLSLSRPPKVGGWLCGNRARLRPGIGHSSVAVQRSNPRLRATASLFRPAKPAGKLGGTATLHRARHPHQERLCAGRLKNIPFQGRGCPRQREFRTLRAAR